MNPEGDGQAPVLKEWEVWLDGTQPPADLAQYADEELCNRVNENPQFKSWEEVGVLGQLFVKTQSLLLVCPVLTYVASTTVGLHAYNICWTPSKESKGKTLPSFRSLSV